MLLEDPDPLLKNYCRFTVIRKGTPRPFVILLFQVNILLKIEVSKLYSTHTHLEFYCHIPKNIYLPLVSSKFLVFMNHF